MVEIFGSILIFLQENIFLSMGILVFLSVTFVTIAVSGYVRDRGTISRRMSSLPIDMQDVSAITDRRSLRHERAMFAQRIYEYVNKNILPDDSAELSKLRRELIYAGFYDRAAVTWYYVIRIGFLIGGPLLVIAIMRMWSSEWSFQAYAYGSALAAAAGMFGPGFLLQRRRNALRVQFRNGFPELLDLLVVCVDAGLSIVAAIDRVSREVSYSVPALSKNLHMMSLELRAGKSLSEALFSLSDRLGIEEARSFATLLVQSQELGTSLIDALRVYSNEMREKRMSRAEEKAHALPVKLVIPLGLFLFPVMLIVIMLPIVVRFQWIGIF
jgi:tight adherence protein C